METSLHQFCSIKFFEQADQKFDSGCTRLPRFLVLLNPQNVNKSVLSTYQAFANHAIHQYSLVIGWEKCHKIDQIRQKVQLNFICVAQKLRGYLYHEGSIIVLI